MNPIYLKSHGRYYLTTAYQFQNGGPDTDLGAIVFDVTGLPDTSKIKEVARIYEKEFPGGFHESQSYKHSDGRALLFTQTSAPYADVWDIDKVAAGGDPANWRAGRVPPTWPWRGGLRSASSTCSARRSLRRTRG